MRRLILSVALLAVLLPGPAAFAQPGHLGSSDRWMVLSQSTPARTGRATFPLYARTGRLDRVRILAVRGAPRILTVIVEYADRSVERLPLMTRLPSGRDQIIALDPGRRARRLTIVTDPHSLGAYAVYFTTDSFYGS